jgi:ABC-type Na+ efflux pump permease subunit
MKGPGARTRHKVFSPARVVALAGNTVLQLVRLRIFYFLLIFAALIIGSSAFMVNFSFQEQFQVLKDVSLGAMSIFTWLIAVLSTAMILPKEIEDRTVYTILAKPVPRFEYLSGKLLGVFLLLLIATVAMSVMFAAALYWREQIVISHSTLKYTGANQQDIEAMIARIRAATFTWSLVPGILLIYLKAALCASLTLLISTFASSWIFTIIISVVVYFIGHVQASARDYWVHSIGGSLFTRIFPGVVALVFPDLQLFNLVDDMVVGNAIPLGLFAKSAALGAMYIGVYLLVACIIFSGKEL